MKNLQVSTFSIAIGLVFSAGVMAETATRDAYNAGETCIEAGYAADQVKCDLLSGNAKDICYAVAKGTAKVADATREASYKPTVKHRYDVLVAKAKADYAVAKERCDDLADLDKERCMKEAKAAATAVRADAEAQLTTWEANQVATDKTAAIASERRNNAGSRGSASIAVERASGEAQGIAARRLGPIHRLIPALEQPFDALLPLPGE